MYSLCNFPYRQHSEKIGSTWGVERSMYLDRFVICLDATTGMIHPNVFFDLIDLQVLQQHPRRLLLRRCNGACSGTGTVCQQHQQVHLGVYDACWLSSVVLYCLSLSFIVFHCPPLSSIVFHCRPLSSIVFHCLPSSSIVFHCLPLFSIVLFGSMEVVVLLAFLLPGLLCCWLFDMHRSRPMLTVSCFDRLQYRRGVWGGWQRQFHAVHHDISFLWFVVDQSIHSGCRHYGDQWFLQVRARLMPVLALPPIDSDRLRSTPIPIDSDPSSDRLWPFFRSTLALPPIDCGPSSDRPFLRSTLHRSTRESQSFNTLTHQHTYPHHQATTLGFQNDPNPLYC